MSDKAAPFTGGARCSVCQQAIGSDESATSCTECGVEHHDECWEYNGGCGSYGCGQAPEPEGLGSIEIPASYWGKEEKLCPACHREILAAAVRCRHCGSTFQSAQPQSETEFGRQTSLDARMGALRTASIWIFILSMFACAAPFVAVIGSIWYCRNRLEVNRLPGIHRALAKIALVLAIGQTIFMIVVVALHSAA